MTPLKVLIACESSGRVRDAFIRAGCFAMSCDLLATESPGPHYKGDVRDVLIDDYWDVIIAHPTCTRLTNAGARWLIEPPKKLAPWQYPAEVVAAYAVMTRDQRLAFMWDELRVGTEFYKLFQKVRAKKGKAIENPIMHCHARELIKPGPRQVVQPWWFGDPASPGPNRWRDRSRFYPGMAAAMADQWTRALTTEQPAVRQLELLAAA